jgi:hypothetical protein
MPPRLLADVETKHNPAEATMGQTSNGSTKRPRDEEAEDDIEDEDDDSGKKERGPPPSFSSYLRRY